MCIGYTHWLSLSPGCDDILLFGNNCIPIDVKVNYFFYLFFLFLPTIRSN